MYISTIDIIRCFPTNNSLNLLRFNQNDFLKYQNLLEINIKDIFEILDCKNNSESRKFYEFSLIEFLTLQKFIAHLNKMITILELSSKSMIYRNDLIFLENSIIYLKSNFKNLMAKDAITIKEFNDELETTLNEIISFDYNMRSVSKVEANIESNILDSSKIFNFIEKHNLNVIDKSKNISLFRTLITVPLKFHELVINDDLSNIYKNQTLSHSHLVMSELYNIEPDLLKKFYMLFYAESGKKNSGILSNIFESFSTETKDELIIINDCIQHIDKFDSLNLIFNTINIDDENLLIFLNNLYKNVKNASINFTEETSVPNISINYMYKPN